MEVLQRIETPGVCRTRLLGSVHYSFDEMEKIENYTTNSRGIELYILCETLWIYSRH